MNTNQKDVPLVLKMKELLSSVHGIEQCMLLGLTGTIASGKTTVAEMFTQCGACSIDFDILSRKVVEPGCKAFEQIVDFFGEQILQPDGTLNRQQLSGIVFKDPEKRKHLEQFTHPQIAIEFINQLENIITKKPNAIIQIIIPLLIEQNLQPLFHKLIVVYAPQETLIKRLMKRNNIFEKDALRMIHSQISIDEKVQYADFVINNGKDRAHTYHQVDKLWEKLKSIQNCPSELV